MPPTLRRRIDDALRAAPNGASLPETLRSVAESLMRQAREGPASRETALTLLAADALITYACEALAARRQP